MSEFKRGRIDRLVRAGVATTLLGFVALTGCDRGETVSPDQTIVTHGTTIPERAPNPAEKLATPEDARENFTTIAARIMYPAQSKDQNGVTVTLETNSQIYKSAPHPQVSISRSIGGRTYSAHAEFFDTPVGTPIDNLYYRDADRVTVKTFDETPEGLKPTSLFFMRARIDGHTWMQIMDKSHPDTLSAVTDTPHFPSVALEEGVMKTQVANALDIIRTINPPIEHLTQ